jgi:hypothetical protein
MFFKKVECEKLQNLIFLFFLIFKGESKELLTKGYNKRHISDKKNI